MVLKHYAAAFLNLVFGAFSWIVCRYLLLIVGNYYLTEFPMYAGIPHIDFFMSVIHWGLWVFVMIPTSYYLWNNTQRPEVA